MSVQEKKIRGAVIGYGGAFNMGKFHANGMIEAGMEFVAACDLSAERMEQAQQDFPGIRTYTSINDLIAQKDIDLITIITPHNTHAPLAEQILMSGKNCIIEKPMCIHLSDADKLVALAREKGLTLSVFHNRRWDGWYVTLHSLMEQGKIGDIFHVEMFMGGYGNPGDWWRSSKEISGGALYDWGAHLIDYTLGMIPGKIKSVRGVVHNLVWHERSNEDQVDSFIHFENGAMAHIGISSIARAGKSRFRILGTMGAIEGDHESITLYSDIDGLNLGIKVDFVQDTKPSYYQNISDHIKYGTELIVKPEEARRIIAIIETTERSAHEGRELSVPFE